MGKVIGIDLGTVNSVVACIENQDVKIIINEEGARATPSIVVFSPKDERFIGEVAKRQMLVNPENTIHSIIRVIGKSFNEIIPELNKIHYKIKPINKDDIAIEINNKLYRPTEILAMIFLKLKRSAEEMFGQKVSGAVIATPSYFTKRQQQSVLEAGAMANLTIIDIIDRPVAIARAQMFHQKNDQIFAVYDFGGSAFEISVLEINNKQIYIKSRHSNTRLGGNDIDQRIMDWLLLEFQKEHRVDISHDKTVLQRLKEAAERVKMELSSVMETEIHLPFLMADDNGPKHLHRTLKRHDFEIMIKDLIQKTIHECQQTIDSAMLQIGDLEGIILAGGSARIPKIQEIVSQAFSCPLLKQLNPEEAIASGAAIHAGILSNILLDSPEYVSTTLSIGFETEDSRFITVIPKDTRIPCRYKKAITTVAHNQKNIRLHVLQGESIYAKNNISLGEFELGPLNTHNQGDIHIELSFKIDENGTLRVRAWEPSIGIQDGITIPAFIGFVRKHKVEANKSDINLNEDPEISKLRNALERQIADLEKLLNTHQSQLPKKDVQEINTALKRGRVAILKNSGRLDYFAEIYDYIYHFYTNLSTRFNSL